MKPSEIVTATCRFVGSALNTTPARAPINDSVKHKYLCTLWLFLGVKLFRRHLLLSTLSSLLTIRLPSRHDVTPKKTVQLLCVCEICFSVGRLA